MRFFAISVAVLFGSGFFSGCSTIVSGSTQSVSFTSNPEGATIEVDGRTLGKAPLTVTLKKRSGQRLSASLDGYKTVTLPLETRLNGWFWGNIVFGGGIGSTTDGMSGSMNEYSPSHYMITLPPAGTSAIEGKVRLSDEQKIKDFVVVGYRQILEDLRNGQGEYRDSLLSLLKIPKEAQVEATRKLKALADVYADIPEFADRVLDLGRAHINPTPANPPTSERPSTVADISKTFDSAQQFYDALCAQPLEDMPAIVAKAKSAQREALTRYIVKTKGETRALGWTFEIAGYLKPTERECINRYLRENSSYSPVL